MVFLHILTTENGYRHARPTGGGRWACIAPKAYTHAIITGRIGDHVSISNNWCYHNLIEAKAALDAWERDGYAGEPKGWHRHPATGRRLAETDDCYDDDGKLVPIGTMYVRR